MFLAGTKASAAERVNERDYGPLAVRAESALRRQVDAPLRTEFHRRQAFHLGVDAAVLSLTWFREAGGEPRCTLAIVQARNAQTFDALDGQADTPPWACDGEPAIRLSDFDADGCVDVLALFPMRPPSGERFMWPLVLHCERGGRYTLDARRSNALREGRPPSTLAQALVRLGQADLRAPSR